MRRQAPDRLLRRIPRDRVSVALAALLGVGLALRVYFMFAWSPALTGYGDSGIYFQGAVESLSTDPIRTVGYSVFLRLLHGIAPHLILVIIVQHALGLGAAVLLALAAIEHPAEGSLAHPRATPRSARPRPGTGRRRRSPA